MLGYVPCTDSFFQHPGAESTDWKLGHRDALHHCCWRPSSNKLVLVFEATTRSPVRKLLRISWCNKLIKWPLHLQQHRRLRHSSTNVVFTQSRHRMSFLRRRCCVNVVPSQQILKKEKVTRCLKEFHFCSFWSREFSVTSSKCCFTRKRRIVGDKHTPFIQRCYVLPRITFNCLAVFGFIYLFCDVWSTRPAENTSALLRWPELIPSSGLLNWGLKTDVWFAEETETVCCYLKSLFCISKDEQMFFMRINDGVIFKKDDAGHRRPPQSVRSLVW